MGRAIEDLVKEHDVILHALDILDKKMKSGLPDGEYLQFCRELVYFLKTFADKCHHGKEEALLFGELAGKGIRKDGGPVGVFIKEHVSGREYIAQMSKAIEDKDAGRFNEYALKYAAMLRNHIHKENEGLFKTADRVLDGKEQDELYKKFELHEEKVIGRGVLDQLHAMIGKWDRETP